nr:MAG TPA: hypothetical protein [Caudoviricetes sp.]
MRNIGEACASFCSFPRTRLYSLTPQHTPSPYYLEFYYAY